MNTREYIVRIRDDCIADFEMRYGTDGELIRCKDCIRGKTMRLIDADDFIEKMHELYEQAKWGKREIHFSLADLECNVDMMPSIDAVPVIRCKDCKWRDTWVCSISTKDDWFCPKGERKDNE